MEREALKLALEALKTLMLERGSIYEQAITAIKEALAQPAQEPVAWEWNFCERCGKRTADIHTCTPPQGDA
jgi:hypothetical protein